MPYLQSAKSLLCVYLDWDDDNLDKDFFSKLGETPFASNSLRALKVFRDITSDQLDMLLNAVSNSSVLEELRVNGECDLVPVFAKHSVLGA